jgi:hypothetical protein
MGDQMRVNKSDTREYHNQWYKDNKEKRVAQIREYQKRVAEEIRLKKSVPCADCGVSYSYWIMQFDHLSNKLFQISPANAGRLGRKKVLEEIEKCEVVCANCHANRTYNRMLASSVSE